MIFAFGLGAVAVYWLLQGLESWKAIVYPDRSDLTVDIRLGEFETLEECRFAALNKIAELGADDLADYECGLNCEPFLIDLLQCEETTR